MGLKIFIGAAVLTLLFNLFFFDSSWQIGWGFLFLLVNSYFFIVKGEKSNTKLGILAGLLASLFGFFNGMYDNLFIQVVNIMTAAFLSCAALFFFTLGSRFSYQLKSVLIAPFRIGISALVRGVAYLSSSPWSGENKSKHAQNALIRGMMIVIPISFLLLLLFSHADPIFGKYISGFTKNLSSRVIISVLVFTGLFLAAFAKVEKDLEHKVMEITEGKAFELGLIATVISVVLWGFIIFQIKYLFGTVGERELSTLGISLQTYSEYLRRGFVELTIVTAITSGVLYYITQTIKALKPSQRWVIQLLSVIMTFGIIMVMISAGKRLLLQIDTHGLTDIRIFGFFFLAELILIVGMLMISLFKTISPRNFFTPITTGTIVLLIGLNLINVDQFIFKHNPPTINNHVDYQFLSEQGSDAYEGWVKSEEFAQREITDLSRKKEYDKSGLDMARIYDVQYILWNNEKNYSLFESKYGSGKKLSTTSPFGPPFEPQNSKLIVSYNFAEKNAYDHLKASGHSYEKIQKMIAQTIVLQERANLPASSSSSATINPQISQ